MTPSRRLLSRAPLGLRHQPAQHNRLRALERIGLGALTLKLCLQLYLGILFGRAQFDLPAFALALRQSGLTVFPALTLVAATAGVILGQLAARLLAEINLPGLILVPVIYAVTMELIPLLVGILVAGRAGVALAARQANLVASGQGDGLLVSGINPIQFTTGPVLPAMLAMSFALAVWGSLVALGAALLWLVVMADVPSYLFNDALRQALTLADLLEALSKPLIFSLVIALIATANGIAAGRDVAGVSRAATDTMIGAVTAILLIDLGYALAP
ncbi:MAG: ABC transporter permease [Chromatiaceae bacterium]|nr:ABC transporter permease [Chromatiaceae bacterium]